MILILTQCFAPQLGGIETLMTGLAEALAAAGEDVAVYADGSSSERAYDRIMHAPYEIERFGGPKPYRRWRKGRAAAKRVAEGGIEGIIADSWKSVEPLPGTLSNTPIVCLAHGMELPSQPSPAKAHRIERAYARASIIAANSRYTADAVRRFAPDTATLRVVTPPFTPSPAPSTEDLADLTQDLGIAADTPLLASLCRLEPRKGVDQTLQAMRLLGDAQPNLRYVVAGAGPDRERLEALAASFGLADRVTFLGRVSDAQKMALLTRADLFAMPSRRVGDSVEGFGIVYLEAAACGTPSIAGRDGGASDAVLDGETGLLVDGNDPAAIALALETLLTAPEKRAAMGEAARRHAERQTWTQRAPDFLGLLRERD